MGIINGKDNLFCLALEAHKAQKTMEAQNFYLQHLKNHPDDYAALDLLGILYAEQKDYNAAILCFNRALQSEPNSPHCLNHLGTVLQKIGETEQALQAFQRALALKPDYAEAYNNLANVHLFNQDFLKAIENYQQAIQLNPEYTDALNNLALVFLKQHDLQNAEKYFQQALATAPLNVLAHHHLGNIAYEKNEVDNAIYHYEKVLVEEPNHIGTLLNLGAASLKQGSTEKAIQFFLHALQLEPENSIALSNLAVTYFTQKKYDEAIRYYYDLLIVDPHNMTAHFNLAVIYMQQQKWYQAERHLETLFQLGANDENTHINYATVLLKLKQKEKAIRHYQKVLEINPHNVAVQYTLSALTGSDTPLRAPNEYIQSLFDNYAERFDSELVMKLQYHTPELLNEILFPFINDTSLYIVDLGCGTGLSGEALKPFAKKLIGIDLSPNMIAVCQAKNIYDELITNDLITGLQQLSQLELAVAADVLVYFGDLHDVFRETFLHLAEGGLFAFSIEKGNVYPYQLHVTGRYAHHPSYINTLAQKQDFLVLAKKEVVLRKQEDVDVIGIIWVLKKNSLRSG